MERVENKKTAYWRENEMCRQKLWVIATSIVVLLLWLAAAALAEEYEINEDEYWNNLNRTAAYIVIEDGITCIPSSAFDGYDMLEEIRLPKSVTSIDDGAFGVCTNLSTVWMSPVTPVTYIGASAFLDAAV